MSRKCILVFAILFSILFITQKNLPNEPAGTTLHESILLGLEKAEEWSNNAKPAFVLSTDNGDKTNESKRGLNGSRFSWNLIFMDEEMDKYLSVAILDSQVRNLEEVMGYYESELDLSTLKLDSKEAVKLAQANYDLRPGKEWAIGYHFMLAKINDTSVLRIYGRNRNDNFSFVDINADDKTVINAMEKIIVNGLETWSNIEGR